ncbi:MAG: class I SAM-dependent methyltransferase, partial [Poseidonibacter sp.]
DSITGETNAIITFYSESEMLDLLQKHLKLKNYKVFHLDNENYQNGTTILNSDIVIWGTIN